MSLISMWTPVRYSTRTLRLVRRQAPSSSPCAGRAQPVINHGVISQFSTTRAALARKKNRGPKPDSRISQIRYFLQHPENPRPLRFSRSRYLRHWTIHRAWQLYRKKQRDAQQLCLERQYNSMRDACEALRLTGEDGLSITPEVVGRPVVRPVKGLKAEKEGLAKAREGVDLKAAAERQKEVGKLFRTAMMKGGVWQGVPIEYARSQTETPPRTGWNHEWTR